MKTKYEYELIRTNTPDNFNQRMKELGMQGFRFKGEAFASTNYYTAIMEREIEDNDV